MLVLPRWKSGCQLIDDRSFHVQFCEDPSELDGLNYDSSGWTFTRTDGKEEAFWTAHIELNLQNGFYNCVCVSSFYQLQTSKKFWHVYDWCVNLFQLFNLFTRSFWIWWVWRWWPVCGFAEVSREQFSVDWCDRSFRKIAPSFQICLRVVFAKASVPLRHKRLKVNDSWRLFPFHNCGILKSAWHREFSEKLCSRMFSECVIICLVPWDKGVFRTKFHVKDAEKNKRNSAETKRKRLRMGSKTKTAKNGSHYGVRGRTERRPSFVTLASQFINSALYICTCSERCKIQKCVGRHCHKS